MGGDGDQPEADERHVQRGGSAEERAAVIDRAVASTKSISGDELYAILSRQVVAQSSPAPPEDADEYAAMGLSWPRARDAYWEWLARRPTFTYLWHLFAYQAWCAHDGQTLAKLFAKPELAWSDQAQRVWGESADGRPPKDSRSELVLQSEVDGSLTFTSAIAGDWE